MLSTLQLLVLPDTIVSYACTRPKLATVACYVGAQQVHDRVCKPYRSG